MARGLLVIGIVLKRGLLFSTLALLLSSGCYLSPRAASGLARAALVTTVVAANVALLATHDAHYHHHHCGHRHAWRDGRVVYYYGGQWEYYDGYSGGWYYYAD
jgi:hypothetical protein